MVAGVLKYELGIGGGLFFRKVHVCGIIKCRRCRFGDAIFCFGFFGFGSQANGGAGET